MVNFKFVFGIAISIFAVIGLLFGLLLTIFGGFYFYESPAEVDNSTAYAAVISQEISTSPNLENLNLITFRFKAESLSEKELLMGIAPKAQIQNFLMNVPHVMVNKIDSHDDSVDYDVEFISGNQPLNMTQEPFWLKSNIGRYPTITWNPKSGQYWLLLMNIDASQGIQLQYRGGMKINVLVGVGIVFLILSVLGICIGALLTYVGNSERKKAKLIPTPIPSSPVTPSHSSVYGTPSSKVTESTAFCPSCGYHLPAVITDSAFCPKCGEKLD
ncbi:MAG: hypothetical protein ACFFCQ_02830 [Promethearchaeota archaeon]